MQTDTEILNATAAVLSGHEHRIRARVEDGIVTLEGTVDNYSERKAIEIGIRSIDGVQGVFNCICIHQVSSELS